MGINGSLDRAHRALLELGVAAPSDATRNLIDQLIAQNRKARANGLEPMSDLQLLGVLAEIEMQRTARHLALMGFCSPKSSVVSLLSVMAQQNVLAADLAEEIKRRGTDATARPR